MRALSLTLLIFLSTTTSVAPGTNYSFCDLLRNPDQFNGKEVTVRVTWHYGLEWSQLYCLDCMDNGRAWLEIPNQIDNASRNAFRRAPKNAGIVNLTLQGTFMSGAAYGHLGGYRYQIVAHKVSDVVVLLKGMQSSEREREVEKRWACGGTNPK